MASVTSFIRNTPKASLRTYFDQTGIALVPPVNWDAPSPRSFGPCSRPSMSSTTTPGRAS